MSKDKLIKTLDAAQSFYSYWCFGGGDVDTMDEYYDRLIDKVGEIRAALIADMHITDDNRCLLMDTIESLDGYIKARPNRNDVQVLFAVSDIVDKLHEQMERLYDPEYVLERDQKMRIHRCIDRFYIFWEQYVYDETNKDTYFNQMCKLIVKVITAVDAFDYITSHSKRIMKVALESLIYLIKAPLESYRGVSAIIDKVMRSTRECLDASN
jgi:hypothetical protein